MESQQIYTSHIQINHTPKKSGAESFAVGFEPSEENLSSTGNIYLLFEQSSKEKIINFESLVTAVGEAYYESGSDIDFEDRFKQVLKSLNAIIKDKNLTYNIIIVATSNNKMLFSDTGTTNLMLIRNGSSSNLSSNSKSPLFREIGQGKLQPKDKILLTSNSLLEKFSHKDLAIMASKQSSRLFSEQISETVSAIDPEANYSALLVTTKSTKPEKNESNIEIHGKPKISDAKFKSLMLGIQKSIKDTTSKGKSKIKSLNKNNGKFAEKITTKTKGGWTAFWSKYINPNPKQAIIVVISTILILLAIFWASSTFSGKPKSLNQLENAQTLISSAQTSLSKNNQSSAQESINKAQDILSGISANEQRKLDQLANNKKIKSGYSSTQASLTELEDKISSTVRIGNQNSFSISVSNLKSLAWLGGSLLGLDSDNGKLVEINPLLGSPSLKAASSELNGAITMDSFNDLGLLILSRGGVLQYTSDKGLQKLSANGLPNANDITGYLSNVYLLSPSESQVIRYAKSGLNLSSKASILKNISSSELNKATSFAVNGNIFVATEDKLLLFEQGSERSYQINNLPSDFGKIKDLYYSKDAGYFVLLNDTSKRLALLSADPESANYIKQYALDGDTKISSFTIEPKNSQILINSGNKIFTYKIEK